MAGRTGLRSSKRASALSASPIISVLGGLNIDLVYETERFPVLGESMTAKTLNYYPGGKGLNTAVAAYRASHMRQTEAGGKRTESKNKEGDIRVFMSGAVGDDEFGRQLHERMKETGIDSSGVATHEGQASGTCVVIVELDSGESRNIGQMGANTNCAYPARIEDLAGNTGSKPDLFITNIGVPREVVEYSLELASKAGVETILNPSSAEYLVSDTYLHVSHLILNESETAILSARAPDDTKDWEVTKKSAQEFINLGVKYVVITLSEKGAYFATHDGDTGLVPAEKVKVKDSTGAGDSFLGAYAVEWIRQKRKGEWNIRKAIAFACKAAARTIEELGAQEALPWADEIEIEREPQSSAEDKESKI